MSIAHVKSLVAAALIGVTALTSAVEPAAAGQWHGGGGWGGGWHGGGGWGGGWHGGGWHGGGWVAHPGWGWRAGGWGHPAYGWGGGWNGGGWGWGVPLLAGGVIAGAAIAASQYPSNGCYQLQPTYDRFGNFVSQQWVYVCR
jgi:hypothetical protein